MDPAKSRSAWWRAVGGALFAALFIASGGVGIAGGHGARGQTAGATTSGADHSTLQNGYQRSGHSTDPVDYTPGIGFLQWFAPAGFAATTSYVVTNNNLTPIAPYGTVATPFPAAGTWKGAQSVLKEASNYYPITGFPHYLYAGCTPSSKTSPIVAEAGTAAYFDWQVTPTTAGNYAVYVWIPIGPTDTAPVNASGQYAYPQRYYVYQILFGNGQTYTDIVDTYAAAGGGNWVRLGNGGYPTNVVFPQNGPTAAPIHVRLYNTVPRDSNGNLTTGTETTASTYLVYANAAMATPTAGYMTASPTAVLLRDANGNPVPDPNGDPDVGPDIAGKSYFARLVTVLNQAVPGIVNGNYEVTSQGVVQNYQMNPSRWRIPGTPDVLWNYSVSVQSQLLSTVEAEPSSVTAAWVQDVKNPNFQGTYYYSTALSPTVAAAQTATWSPTLATGQYQIYAYLPGNGGGEQYGIVSYNIYQGSVTNPANLVATVPVNQGAGGGWVLLSGSGASSFMNIAAAGSNPAVPLNIQLVASNGAAQPGLLAYANALKFVGAANGAINSTPVHADVQIAQPGGGTNLTQVVIVADETGKIHCLDETGNGDGTTTEYWSYPSTPNPNVANWVDPNLSSGIDGTYNAVTNVSTTIAQMPIQFNLSSALVKVVNGTPRLFIASSNGRIYCIDMTGRGDWVKAGGVVGTTTRLWSYPNDYPATAINSTLGAFRGSLVYGDATDGASGQTIFAAAPQGRVYALAAGGDLANRTTTVRWAFPALKSPTLAPIQMTPNLSFNSIFFGTMQNPNTDGPGVVYSLNASTGALQWHFDGTGLNGSAGVPEGENGNELSDFLCGPTSASAVQLNDVGTQVNGSNYTVTPQDSVYFLNNNASLYGFNAHTGALLTTSDGTNLYYDTNELNQVSDLNLGLDWMTTYDRFFQQRRMPVVYVPTSNGAVYGMFANADDYNINTTDYLANPLGTTNNPLYLAAYGQGFFGSETTSVALANQRMFVGDSLGFIYALDNNAAGNGLEVLGNAPPNGAMVTPNQPGPADAFRVPEIEIITANAFNALQPVGNTNQGALSYTQATAAANQASKPPYAFEWGQTVYIMVYHFAYQPPLNPPQVNLNITVNGVSKPPQTAAAYQFANPTTAPPAVYLENSTYGKAGSQISVNSTDWYYDGYALFKYVVPFSMVNNLPPGPGTFSVQIGTSAFTANNATQQQVMADPAYGRLNFSVDNPIGVDPLDPWFGTPANPNHQPYGVYLNGGVYTTNSQDPQSEANGTPALAPLQGAAKQPGQLITSTGFTPDNSQPFSYVYLFDRSLVATQLPPGQGLQGVFADRSDLLRQGGVATQFNALSPAAYPGFEDQPIYYPNVSLDYPDISLDNVSFSLPNQVGSSSPLSNGINLLPPLSSVTNQPLTVGDTSPNTRLPQPTLLKVLTTVPKYQPPVNYNELIQGASPLWTGIDPTIAYFDQNGNPEPQGYLGRIHVFVGQGGQFSTTDAYRQFQVGVGVVPTYRGLVQTPTVDDGSLPEGALYGPTVPYLQNPLTGPASPWGGVWTGAYQPFTFANDSNINWLEVRLAKGTDIGLNDTRGALLPWAFYSATNGSPDESSDPYAALPWLAGSFNLVSNIDSSFAPVNPHNGNANNVFAQKPRVTDRTPNAMTVNPYPRANAALGIGAGANPLNTSLPGGVSPVVSVSVPFGFPAGTYISQLRLIDDSPTALGSHLGGGNTPYATNSLSQIWEPLYAGGTPLNAVEPFSDPGLTLSFTARETRVTNTSTTYAATMADNQLVSGDLYEWANTTPTAMRDSFGSIIAAWSSNRTAMAAAEPGTPVPNEAAKIFVASVPNEASFTNGGITTPGKDPVLGTPASSPLRDLNYFYSSTGTSWFTPETPAGYPTTSLFPAGNDGTVIAGTEKYYFPSFPITGDVNPIGNNFGSTYMAFVGSAQKSTNSGRIGESKVFLTSVTTGNGGGVSMNSAGGSPWLTKDDALTQKGKPSVVQTSTGAFVFYSVTAAGQTNIHEDRFTGSAFVPAVELAFGSGFESVDSPSGTIRPYVGGNTNKPAQLIDLTFTGKLRGRPNADIYLGQLNVGQAAGAYQIVDANGVSIEQANSGSPFMFFNEIDNELLVAEGKGVFRARGVDWGLSQSLAGSTLSAAQTANPVRAFALYQYNADGSAFDLLNEATKNVDRETGVISYDTSLGGKVYIDPTLGTVQFSSATPARSSQIRLSYFPGFLRVSAGGAAYNQPSGIYDNHYVNEYTMWWQGNNASVPSTANLTDGRFAFFYGRTAGGNGLTARPYMSTMRFGAVLPTRLLTTANGGLAGLTVTGNKGPYQADPANGRIYFTPQDEDRTVTISYIGVNESTGGALPPITDTVVVSLVPEQAEGPVFIDQPVDETNVFAFIDPFTYANSQNSPGNGRPPLFWLFYSSTRSGASDIYMQTIAPRLTPVVK